MQVPPALVELAQRGDEAAFERLAGALIERLRAVASLILHDASLADDAMQETLVRVWRDLPRLRDVDCFDGWLHSVLAHTCLDLIKRERRVRHLRQLPLTLADRQHLEAEVADRDAVDRALAQLKPPQRAVLVLRHYAGYSPPEVAEILGVPLGTAKSRLHYAEEAMHAAIDADSRLVPMRGALP